MNYWLVREKGLTESMCIKKVTHKRQSDEDDNDDDDDKFSFTYMNGKSRVNEFYANIVMPYTNKM